MQALPWNLTDSVIKIENCDLQRLSMTRYVTLRYIGWSLIDTGISEREDMSIGNEEEREKKIRSSGEVLPKQPPPKVAEINFCTARAFLHKAKCLKHHNEENREQRLTENTRRHRRRRGKTARACSSRNSEI